jgi:hypothetical protein
MYGMRVASELPLPVEPVTGEIPDVCVSWGPPTDIGWGRPPGLLLAEPRPATRDTDDELGGAVPSYSVTAFEGGYILRFHGACDVLVSADLTQIECCPDRRVDRDLISILLAGTVAALVLALAGRLVLHASVVRNGLDTVGFIGPSGSGKSTVAALCCVAGAALVSDDVLVLDCEQAPVCVGGWPELRLRPGAASIADSLPAGYVRRRTADGRLAVRGPSDALPPTSLTAVVLPRPSRTVSQVSVDRLDPEVALLSVLRAGRIEGWRRSEDLRRQFEMAATVVSSVPLLVADVPWGEPFLPELGHALLDCVASSSVSDQY